MGTLLRRPMGPVASEGLVLHPRWVGRGQFCSSSEFEAAVTWLKLKAEVSNRPCAKLMTNCQPPKGRLRYVLKPDTRPELAVTAAKEAMVI